MEHFLKTTSVKYNLDAAVLLEDWSKFDKLNTEYNKLKKPELVELCKNKGYKSTGSKPELIVYLLDEVKLEDSKPVTLKRKKEEPPAVVKTNILAKISAEVPNVIIRRNLFGHHEHVETGFIFDSKTKKVKGKQLTDGNILPLTRNDIETCHKYKFEYDIPEKLDDDTLQTTNLDDKEFCDNLDEEDMVEMEDVEDDSDEDIEYVE
jgi:hypothetical protein